MRPLPAFNPPNPWHSTAVEYLGEAPVQPLVVYEDQTRSVLSENTSPDLGFRWSLNPYRGCHHGCAYCYARPSHEYLGFGSGADFERKIVVKRRAPELLRRALEQPSWKRELILMSGDTDCYQPLEASLELTRACLGVCAEFENPVHVITKAPLVERDLDVLRRLAECAQAGVTVTIPFFDEVTARAIEPGVAPPARRLRTVRTLADAGIRVCVNIAPVIPGLNDRDIGRILAGAAAAGASRAAMIPLRLPGSVKQVFFDRLEQALPLAAPRVLARIREMRGGRLNDSRFGWRMQGQGPYIEGVWRLFETLAKRHGLQTWSSLKPGA
jgi:DNA repair photolyase